MRRRRFDGRPLDWPTSVGWIFSGFARSWLSLFTGIVCAWFGVPFAVLLAGIGAIVGGIGGVLSGSAMQDSGLDRLNVFVTWIFPLPVPVGELVPTVAWWLGSIIGGVLGAGSGATQMFLLALWWPWEQLYRGDPAWPIQVAVGQVIVGLVVGAGYVIYSVAFERWRLTKGSGGARTPARREVEWLEPMMVEVAGAMGLKGLPSLLIDDSREVNAFAHARHIVVTRGLLDYLGWDRAMVQGVVAHELAHWRRGDAIALTLLKGVSLPLYLAFEFATRVLDQARFKPLQWLLRMLLWGVLTTVRYVVVPVHARAMRQMETRADADVKAAGFAPGLHAALELMGASFDGSRSGWDRAMCATHPATEHRLEALEVEGGRYDLVAASTSASAGASTAERGW